MGGTDTPAPGARLTVSRHRLPPLPLQSQGPLSEGGPRRARPEGEGEDLPACRGEQKQAAGAAVLPCYSRSLQVAGSARFSRGREMRNPGRVERKPRGILWCLLWRWDPVTDACDYGLCKRQATSTAAGERMRSWIPGAAARRGSRVGVRPPALPLSRRCGMQRRNQRLQTSAFQGGLPSFFRDPLKAVTFWNGWLAACAVVSLAPLAKEAPWTVRGVNL